MDYVPALDDSVMDVEMVDSLTNFCQTKEEIEQIKGYEGDKDGLGKCELFYMGLMKVPHAEAKLSFFSYNLQFSTKVLDLRANLNVVHLSIEQIRSSVKLRRIMHTILSLGNALNQGTSRGAAVGFRLDSILKLIETRATNNKMTLLHYLCKVLADKFPELLDFSKELGSLEAASKIQLKAVGKEMQFITKGLEKVIQEKRMCKKDGHVCKHFQKSVKNFITSAEGKVKALALLYSGLGKSLDYLIIYFGEDPARCPYEKVIKTLLTFVRMFNQAHDENCKQIDREKKAAQKEAEEEKLKLQKHPKKDRDDTVMDYVLALDDSVMDVEMVDNLTKFCQTKEEMEQIKGYKGDKDGPGKCELFYMGLKVPHAEAKLSFFSYNLQFSTKVLDLRANLNVVYLSIEQIRSSVKLRRIMHTILSLGNALNQGTSRGSAVGFRLDSILKLIETRATNNKMTLLHYLCKVLADKFPELLDFSKDFGSLEAASKIQLKAVAKEMQFITKGLEKVIQEKRMCKKDGHVCKHFQKSLENFITSAEGKVKALALLYSGLGKSVDSLIVYFGEDPVRCPYEKVITTLLTFVRMFNQAHDENCKQIEAENKAAQKEAEEEKLMLQKHPKKAKRSQNQQQKEPIWSQE